VAATFDPHDLGAFDACRCDRGVDRRHDAILGSVDEQSLGPLAPWFALGAGIAAVVGSFMPWVTMSAPFIGTVSKSGVDGTDGWVTAGLDVVVILLGAMGVRGSVSRAMNVFGGLGALGVLGLGAWTVVDLFARERDMRADMASQPDDAFGIGRAMADAVQVHVGTGLWLVVFGGLVGVVAAFMLLVARRSG
jgi:hypothetical protein